METNGEAVLDALGDPTRRTIFRLLARQPRAVGALAEQLPVSRPAVSQHLKVLKDAGLVVDRAEGTRRVYRVNLDARPQLHAYFESLWADALAAFKAAAEAEPSDQERKKR